MREVIGGPGRVVRIDSRIALSQVTTRLFAVADSKIIPLINATNPTNRAFDEIMLLSCLLSNLFNKNSFP